MKVTDLKENECIHCETEEQATAICKLMHEEGLKWIDGYSYLSKNDYDFYTSKTCYIPKLGTFSDLSFVKEKNYKIYKAEQFLTKNTEIMSTTELMASQKVLDLKKKIFVLKISMEN